MMPKARRSSYNLAFKLKIVAEVEAIEHNSEIARKYGISESMVHCWLNWVKHFRSGFQSKEVG